MSAPETSYPSPPTGTHRRRWTSLLAVAAVLVLASGCNTLAFGRNVDGRLGIGSRDDQSFPVTLGGTLSIVDGGDTHACGINPAGALFCWGSNLSHQLGTDTGNSQLTPVRVGTDADWVAVSAGGSHTCGIRATSELFCWGDNADRQVTTITGDPRVVEPTRVGTNFLAVSTGQRHTCGLQSQEAFSRPDDVHLRCWGFNGDGRLGIGETGGFGSATSGSVAGVADWESVAAGVHTCAIRDGGRLFCWGGNADGQLGTGDQDPRLEPAPVGAATGWSQVGAGERHSCAIRTTGSLHCWGSNFSGQLGDGNVDGSLVPSPVEADGTWTAVSLGGAHTCGIQDGHALCWGANNFGAVGDGTDDDRRFPVPVGDRPAVAVSAGRNHTHVVR